MCETPRTSTFSTTTAYVTPACRTSTQEQTTSPCPIIRTSVRLVLLSARHHAAILMFILSLHFQMSMSQTLMKESRLVYEDALRRLLQSGFRMAALAISPLLSSLLQPQHPRQLRVQPQHEPLAQPPGLLPRPLQTDACRRTAAVLIAANHHFRVR